MIQGSTKIYGVIGDPIEHTMSPLMHNFYAAQTGLNMAYVPFRVSAGQIGAAIAGAHALNISGLNVTVPHKQNVMPHLVELDETARVIGAVNTLVWQEHGYKGYNTDAPGLLRSLKEAQIAIKDEHCIILGAGGAAKAAAYMLVKEGAKSVYVINRSVARAAALCEEINRLFDTAIMRPVALDQYMTIPAERYLAIQATNVGMHPDIGGMLIRDTAFYERIHTGVDIIYTPENTAFMKAVAAAGGKVLNGLAMLLYQGIEAFYLWNPGIVLDQDIIAQAKQRMTNHLKR